MLFSASIMRMVFLVVLLFIAVTGARPVAISFSSPRVQMIIARKVDLPPCPSELTPPAQAHKPQRIVRRETITMSPTKGSEIPSEVPSSSLSTASIDDTRTPEGTVTQMENRPDAPMAGLTTPQLAGIIAAGFVAFTLAISLLAFCLLRRRRVVTVEKKDIEGEIERTKSLEIITLNLEASNNRCNSSPIDVVKTPQFPSLEGKNQSPITTPKLPAFKTELEVSGGILDFGAARTNITGAPIVPASTLTSVIESPASFKPATQHRKSSISQAVRKMSATFASIVTSSPNTEHVGNKDHSEMSGTFGARNTPSPWAWGNSINGREPVTPVDYLGPNRWDTEIDPLSKEIEVGIAITDGERPARPGVVTNDIPPPPNPAPTSALPIPPKSLSTAVPSKSMAKERRRPLPTMTIPVPSATATATANLATFTLLHQSLCHASTIYTSEAEGCSPTTISPASSTRYTYCEGMSPTSPASYFCGTNHSSCIWSCSSSGGTPRSSRHTLSLYSVPSTPHRSSRVPNIQCSSHSPPGYFTASASEAPPLPTSVPMNLNKGRGMRPGPLNLSQKKKKPQRDHLAGELVELPPSPRRLPEEIVRVTREMRERQQDEVLRRLFGDVPATAGLVPNGITGVAGMSTGNRARSGSVATSLSRKGSESAGFGVYGGNWPDRI
ncbi:hypothetical protein EV426DRAFT_576303 [Tirmania nivea]|nr:hypothetical protein EV426DRAFT_576303 [Tirmania nivea]